MRAKWIAMVVAAVGLVIAAMWGTGHLHAIAGLDAPAKQQAQTPSIKPPAVTVIRPASQTFAETLRVSGSLVAREEVLVAPQIEGQRIRELLVEAGDRVKQDQLLARLATENLDALVAQADATIQRSEAGIARAQSAITQAQAQLKEAAAALKRAKPLSRSGYLSDSTLDQRQSVATAAQAALAIAQGSLKVAESEKVEAEAKRRELLWRRSRSEIRAPVAGLVLSRSAKLGGIATAVGESMFRIAKHAEIEFEGEVTSHQLHKLSAGQVVRITVPGRTDIRGTVRLVPPRVDPETRLGHVRIFIGPDPDLRVGTFATGIIQTASGRGLAIPASAIMRDADGPYVQVVRDNTIRIQRLETGLVSDGYVEIREGLTSTDQVVAKAGTFLGEGERITPVEPSNGLQQTAAQPTAG